MEGSGEKKKKKKNIAIIDLFIIAIMYLHTFRNPNIRGNPIANRLNTENWKWYFVKYQMNSTKKNRLKELT